MESFARVRSDRLETPQVQFSARVAHKVLGQLPGLKLNHLNALTDDTGVLQHAIFTIPNRAEGYTTDDNARVLILTVLRWQLSKDQDRKVDSVGPDFSCHYLSFLEHSTQTAGARSREAPSSPGIADRKPVLTIVAGILVAQVDNGFEKSRLSHAPVMFASHYPAVFP